MSENKQHAQIQTALDRAEAIKSRNVPKTRLISSDIEYVIGNSQHDRGSKTEMSICRETLQKREHDLSR